MRQKFQAHKSNLMILCYFFSFQKVFREHSIDGCTLPLLTEEHLIGNMNMKLGPALKLRSVLAKKIGHCAICLHCVHCHSDPTASGQQSPVREQETGAEI